MKRVVVNNVLFVQGGAQIDNFGDDSIGNNEPLRREKLRSFFELIHFIFPPQSLSFLNSLVCEVPRR